MFCCNETENNSDSFDKAKCDLKAFFESKGISDIEIILSDMPPQADKISGKFKHIYKDF
ncbi:MAG: hypothetical protein II059_02505 [Clostridia bacterium]|nr:hypothetical protein [Clostridia bacterium]